MNEEFETCECPCGQRIEYLVHARGTEINCPGCQHKLICKPPMSLSKKLLVLSAVAGALAAILFWSSLAESANLASRLVFDSFGWFALIATVLLLITSWLAKNWIHARKILRNRWFVGVASAVVFYLGWMVYFTTHANRFYWDVFVWGLIGVVHGPVYMLPTLIGLHRRNVLAIFILNLFLGWTGIGWVVALIWAVLKDKEI